MSTTLELSNYPILDDIKSTLFPHLPEDQYIEIRQDVVGVVEAGAHMCPQKYLVTVS